jgi:hypothetical protein
VPQQFHLDFRPDDLDAMEELALELGAAKPDDQPGDGRWRVLLDPAGHPFCLTSGLSPGPWTPWRLDLEVQGKRCP